MVLVSVPRAAVMETVMTRVVMAAEVEVSVVVVVVVVLVKKRLPGELAIAELYLQAADWLSSAVVGSAIVWTQTRPLRFQALR